MEYLQKGAILSSYEFKQEPITRSLQLPNILDKVFSLTDLCLVWIYLELRFPQYGNLSD